MELFIECRGIKDAFTHTRAQITELKIKDAIKHI